MKTVIKIFSIFLIVLFIGCGGGSSSNYQNNTNNSTANNSEVQNSSEPDGEGWGGNSQIPSNPYQDQNNSTYSIIWNLSQGFINGVLSEADVKIYDIEDYDLNSGKGVNPIYLNKTSSGDTITLAGIIPIVSTLESNKTYVVELEGGVDLYANSDNQLLLNSSVANQGTIRLVMTGFELKNSGAKVSILSELVYQLTKNLYNQDDLPSFVEKSNQIARCLLKGDVNYDGAIDMLDVLSWTPFMGKDKLNHDYNTLYKDIADKIHSNLSIYDDAVNIYKKPIFSDKKIYIKSSELINTTVGKLSFVCGEEDFVSYDVIGENSEYFTIDSDKNIILKNNSLQVGNYMVEVSLNGFDDFKAKGTINIEVVNSSAPTLENSNFTNVIPTTIAKGYNLGRAALITSPGSLTSIYLTGFGASNFEIDKNGYISISQNANLKREDGIYNLQIFASNDYGTGAPLDIAIKVYTQTELIPKIKNTNITLYGAEILAGKMVGVINQEVNQFCTISEFVLNNSTIFDIYPSGNIYTKETPLQDSYTIDVYAVSSCGNSNMAKLKIDRKEQILCEISTHYAKGVTASLDNTKIFIADEREGLKIIDISDPLKPYMVGKLDTYDANGIVLSKEADTAYIADGHYGLKIIDVSDLSNPTLIGTISTTYAQKIVLSDDGKKAYIADVNGGLTIIDISNSTNPHVLGSINTYATYDVAVSSNNKKAYIASGFTGVKVFDISDLSSIELIGSLSTTYAKGITISSDDTKLFIADSTGGLKIVDINSPSTPLLIGKVNTTNAHRITISSNNQKAYIADGLGGVKIIDISNVTNPTIVNSINIEDARDITISRDNSKLFVADSSGGFKVIGLVK